MNKHSLKRLESKVRQHSNKNTHSHTEIPIFKLLPGNNAGWPTNLPRPILGGRSTFYVQTQEAKHLLETLYVQQ